MVRASNGDETAFLENLKLFFEKDLMNIHDENVPNWFYYWIQFIPDTFYTIPSIKLYDLDACAFVEAPDLTLSVEYAGFPYDPTPGVVSTYGQNKYFANAGTNKNPVVAAGCDGPDTDVTIDYPPEDVALWHKILIGEGCGHRKLDPRDLSETSNIEGLYVLLSTLIHEREHALIKWENWKEGWRKDLDVDGDGYNDEWEQMIRDEGIFLFDPNELTGKVDEYDDNYIVVNGEILKPNGEPASVGTVYEETRCRNREKQFLDWLETAGFPWDQFDWSFDPLHLNQGKNWKPE